MNFPTLVKRIAIYKCHPSSHFLRKVELRIINGTLQPIRSALTLLMLIFMQKRWFKNIGDEGVV